MTSETQNSKKEMLLLFMYTDKKWKWKTKHWNL